MEMENKLHNQTDYNEVLDFLNSFEDIDGMMLDALQDVKPQIKVISGDLEMSYDYDTFLNIFDSEGLEAL